MKLKLDAKILDLEDKPILNPDETEVTLSVVCINALMSTLEQDKGLSGDKKAALFTLALSLKGGNEEVTVEEVAMIKERIGIMFGQLIVGRVYALIEN